MRMAILAVTLLTLITGVLWYSVQLGRALDYEYDQSTRAACAVNMSPDLCR